MAISRGNQYEHAVMAQALSRIEDPTLDEESRLSLHRSKISDQQVFDTAQRFMNNIWNVERTNPTSQQFYKSFKQLGGRNPEPKTDVLFVKNGTRYRCSMKWDDAWQLGSAGIQGSVSVMNMVLQKIAIAGGMGGGEVIRVAEILDWMGDTMDLGKLPQTQIRPLVERGKQQGEFQDLQRILGSRQQPQPDRLYIAFKREFIRESLTGSNVFGVSNDRCATHILDSTPQVSPITDAMINGMMDRVFVDIRLKNRGYLDPDTKNQPINEAVLRIEPVT